MHIRVGRKHTLCANLCCWTLRAVAVGRMRERDPEYGDTEGRTAARVLDDNARCMMQFRERREETMLQ